MNQALATDLERSEPASAVGSKPDRTAVSQARQAAGEPDIVTDGAQTAQPAPAAGVLTKLQIHACSERLLRIAGRAR